MEKTRLVDKMAAYRSLYLNGDLLNAASNTAAEHVYQVRLKNGVPVYVVAGEMLPAVMAQAHNGGETVDGALQLAENVEAISITAPNVLPQTRERQALQIANGHSVVMCVPIEAGLGQWEIVRYTTLYPYDHIPHFAEVGTSVSFDTSYSQEKNGAQHDYPSIGTELYRAIARLADEHAIGAIGTTTGNAALQASHKAGFVPAPRWLLSHFANGSGPDAALAEVCTCGADKMHAKHHSQCRRSIDTLLAIQGRFELILERFMRASQSGVSARDILNFAEKYISPCIFRYYVGPNHPHHDMWQPLLQKHRLTDEVLKTIIQFRNQQAGKKALI